MSSVVGTGVTGDQRLLERDYALVTLLSDVTRVAHDAAELVEAGRHTLLAVCRATGWPVGHLLLPTDDGTGEYSSSGVWRLPEPAAFPALRELSSAVRFAPGDGLVGRAAATATVVWSADVTSERRFAGASPGVCASFVVPVPGRNAVAAILEFFSPSAIEPDLRLLDVLTDVGKLLAPVADRREAGIALQASRDRLEQILETSAEAFVAMDDQGVITGWNAAAESLFGYARVDALGRDLIDTLVPPRHRTEYRQGLDRLVVADGQLTAASGRYRLDQRVEAGAWHAAGREVLVELAISSLRGPDGRWTFHAFLHDISERRRGDQALRTAYEHERQALAKLKELDEAKTNFLATVSHELRTPLTSLAGYLELMVDGDMGPVSAVQHEALSAMARNADRLRAMIEDLLTVSRMQASPLELKMTPTDVPALVSEACAEVLANASGRGHHVELDIDPRVVEMFADPAQLRRVVTSLLDNAVKCTEPGGRIEVRVHQIGGVAEISVSDNGVGIDPAEVPRLFTRFFRTTAATRLAIQGAGLSLAIARQIVDGHGGTISVRSSPGVGSTFTVRLPIIAALDEAA